MASKQVGENALQRMARLMKKFNEQMDPEVSGNQVKVILEPDGGGQVVVDFGLLNSCSQTIFEFVSTDEVLSYLEASMLDKLLMSIDWAKSRC